MSKRRRWCLQIEIFILLLLFGVTDGQWKSRQSRKKQEVLFAFTAPVYNLSLEENAQGPQFARSTDIVRIGVPQPDPDSTVRFKIVEGDKGHLFKAHAKVIGDFVFLRIRQKEKSAVPLNRELKDSYELVVKALSKRPSRSNLETTARVHLRVRDQNDAGPVFLLEAERYEAKINDLIEPFSDVLRVEAFDSDIGLNGQIYYSLVNRSSDFTLDPVSGWLKTLRNVRPGVYDLVAKAEDRTSRLFYYDEDLKQLSRTTLIRVVVQETKKKQPKIFVELMPVKAEDWKRSQLAAVVRLEDVDVDTLLGLVNDENAYRFHLNQSDNEQWMLYTVAGYPVEEGSNVTLSAGNELKPDGNTTAVIRVEVEFRHGISFGGRSKLTFSVHEAAAPGFVIGRVSADVSNIYDVDNIRYHVESLDQNVSLPFRVEDKTGNLRVAKRLDYELEKTYRFNVFAKLKGYGEQASVLVEVEVIDSNDHSPSYAAKWTRQGPIPVSDDTKIGTVVLKVDALDQDAGENGRVGYKLSADKNVPFEVDFETGDLKLTSALPKRENDWRVTVWAVDWGKPLPRSAALHLIFYRNGTKTPAKLKRTTTTEPSNNEAPKFSSDGENLIVNENAQIGTVIGKVSATDSDLGYNGLVQYTTWNEYFAVDSDSGEIKIAANLSKLLPAGKKNVVKDVEILAHDEGNPQKFAKKTIHVDILDVNNHSPVFDQPYYRIKIAEDTKVGTVVLKLSASDDDFSDSARVGFQLAGDVDANVAIDDDGKVTLVRQLDREKTDMHSYTVVAYDHGVPRLLSFANLTIEVTDVNDNAPSCVDQINTVQIAEDYPDGALVGCVAARDADLGQNARLRFTIDNKEKPPFRIDHHTGCVFVHSSHRPLDYQRKPVYNLTIDVADNAESMLSTTCSLIIRLVDVDQNLNPPYVDDVAHEASVYENMPVGTVVYRVMARDPDKKDGSLSYAIVEGDGMGFFHVDQSGIIRTSLILDREEQWKYWLTVEITDDAIVPKMTIVHVFVRVLDKNDHRPMPRQPVYFVKVPENSRSNVVLTKIEAWDGDDLDGQTSQLQFKITKGDPQSFFNIDINTGYITTSGSRKLDRETQKEHELWVSVCDHGEPQHCTAVLVVVTIEDQNDNPPVFTQPINHHNVPSGVTSILCRISATDPDAGENADLFYNITEGDARFAIDEHGYISTSKPLGHDEVYPLTVQATDRGLPAHWVQSRVVLTASPPPKRTAKNRRPQILNKNLDMPIPISDVDPVGVTLAMLEATDSDGDTLWWSIVDGNVGEIFSVRTDSGTLLLAKSIENLPRNISEIVLTVRVSDGDAFEERKMRCQLSRSPSSRPQFSASHYKTQISENTAIGTQIYSVKAVPDRTGGDKKPVTYSIHVVDDVAMEDKLRIEPRTGNVLVMESLDFEVSRDIEVIVKARQGSLVNFATLSLSVTDSNDNAPHFIVKNVLVRIPQRLPKGFNVKTMLATDADSGLNGVIKYSIISGNEERLFNVESATGQVQLAEDLPGDHVESILTIRATDSGTRSLMDTATLRVLSFNENPADQLVFTRSVYQRTVKESTAVGSVLLAVSTEPNGQARYGIQQPCPYFDVHPLSGAVTLRKWLTLERSKTVSCTVLAKSHDGLEDKAKVVIKTTNTNQHSPVFRQQIYHGFVRENLAAGSSVLLEDDSPLVLNAVDADAGPNALVGYRLLGPDDPNFLVDYVSGAIRTRRPIDYEKMKSRSFYVQANDMGHPMRTSPLPALVIVDVLDVNDEAPTFEKKRYDVDLRMPTVVGVVLLKLSAVDLDTVGVLRYYLKNKDMSMPFAINNTDGTVTVASSSSNYKESEYDVEVYVTDGVRSSSCLVHVTKTTPSGKSGFRFPQEKYFITVKENETFTQLEPLIALTTIGAADGVPVTYSILNEREEFVMNAGTGVIAQTGKALDREIEPVIRLLVQARTHEKTILLAQTVLEVKLEDENDNSPQFVAQPYVAVVSLEAKQGDTIINVKAVDRDAGANGMVQYSSRNLPSVFKLNKYDGKLTVAKTMTGTKKYYFEVEATDQGKTPLKSITPVIVDVVEKSRPLFSEQIYHASVSELSTKNTTVAVVKAVSNAGGHILYRMVGKNDVFDVDSDTGAISVMQPLDKSEKDEYNLTIVADDVTRDGMNATASVIVTVSGTRNSGPRMESLIYRVSVIESTPVGAELVTVVAVADDDTVSYAIEGTDASVVSVDMESGVVRLKSFLDFETKSRHHVTIVARDSQQIAAKAKLVIEVLDMNDESPRFVFPFAVAEVADTAEAGQFVIIMSVTDKDSVSSLADGHRLLYSVIDGDETLFYIDAHTGEVSLARRLESEDVLEQTKSLNVSVSDGVFTAYGQLTVKIIVTGQRQPPPRFEQSQYAVAVKENSVVENRSALVVVGARDGVPPLHYSLGGGKVYRAWPVKIDRLSGRVHYKRPLSYKNASSYVIPLIVVDGIGRKAFSTLTLNVVDVNDSPPVFVVGTYSCSISVSAKEGDAVLMVSAVDDDEGDQVEYSMISDDEVSKIFRIHPRQGTISLTGKVDTKVGSVISFLVKATDLANPPHHGTAKVEISVVSARTQVPKFSNSHYMFVVAEDTPVGTMIGKMQQIEQDVEVVHFSILEQPPDLPVTMEKTSGRMIVSRPLDREHTSQWRFAVRVDAPGGAHAVTIVTIRVTDVDDNAPVFHGSYERQLVSEDAPVGTSIAVFSATDADTQGGRIEFSLLEDVNVVEMDPESGWLLVSGPLDRETKDQYDLTARATDAAGNTQDVKFNLEITDVNDCSPTFAEKTYKVLVDPVDLKIGQTIAHVRVTDNDLPPFNDTRLFISRGNEDGIFAIDDSGRITIAKTNFPQQATIYNLTLLAFDGKFTSTSLMRIHTAEMLGFECNNTVLHLSVKENSKKGTLLYKGGTAPGGRPKHQLVAAKDLPFVVDTHTGAIALSGPVDAEEINKYSFTLRSLSKSSGVECERAVVVLIEDENDNAPVFDQKEYLVTINENEPASPQERKFVHRVNAVDKDSGELGRVRYRMTDGYGVFVIDERSGSITVTGPLDREERSEYSLHILATDGDPKKPRTDKTVVRVEVADQNDNPPVFDKNDYSLRVMESESTGYVLAELRATGGDVGEKVRYSLVDGSHNNFVTLDSKTGVLRLSKGLDFEKEHKLSLRVVAKDDGKPPLSAETQVNIEVLDENDNAPVFAKSSYKADLSEKAKNGTRVVRVQATDADSEHYGRVAYTLVGGSLVPFVVDSKGWIILVDVVDYEKTKSYELLVEARDGGDPFRKTRVAVNVAIIDENDNAPVFDVCNMTAVVQEGLNVGHSVLSVSVSDADGEKFGGPLKLHLKGDGHKAFVFDDAGNLSTTMKLSHARKNTFLLTVVATDQGGRSSECPLTIYVKEESRHPPKISPLLSTVNTLMGEFRGGLVGTIDAKDQDDEDMLRYALVPNTIKYLIPSVGGRGLLESLKLHSFHVDSTTGQVYADAGLPSGLHSFNVSVTDGKYTTVSYVQLEVVAIEPHLVDHAVSVRVRGLTATEFLRRYVKQFREIFARTLNVRPHNIQLLSVQDVSRDGSRSKRGATSDVDILFVVHRGSSERGMLKPDHIYSRLKQDFNSIVQESGRDITYQLITELCTPGVCERGECRERVDMDDTANATIIVAGRALVTPRHSRTQECLCAEGYGGSRCEKEINGCARGNCASYEMCVPGEKNRYECMCPPGTKGDRCVEPDCEHEGRCMQEAELSVGGNGFIDMWLQHEVETRLELDVELRTSSAHGVLMHARGRHDFHALELDGGRLVYRWDCGVGEGVVRSSVVVADGAWHRVKVSRKGRTVRLQVDDKQPHEGQSPPGADVVNLQSSSLRLTFGSKVDRDNSSNLAITDGVVACFRTIAVDGRSVSKTRQGLRLHGVSAGCRAMADSPCAEAPCLHGGACMVIGDTFRCDCGSRYSGDRCDVDDEPCADSPCPLGVQCIPFTNDYLCKCPSGFVGKRCESRDVTIMSNDIGPCANNPCGPAGVCVPLPNPTANFICNCTGGRLLSTPCHEEGGPSWIAGVFGAVSWREVLVLMLVIVSLILLACLIIGVCRFIKTRKSDPKYGDHVTTSGHLTRVPAVIPRETAPPPLPPRGFRGGNNISSLQHAQLSGIPTVEVRPLPPHERVSSSGRGDSRSPSIVSNKPVVRTNNEYGSAADDLNRTGRWDARNLDMLRRAGRRVSDDESSVGSGQGQRRRAERERRHREGGLDNLNKERVPLGDSIQCLPIGDDDPVGWGDGVDRIGEAVRQERLRLEGLNGRMHVGDTVLSPLLNDDDYMTMRPRRAADSAESQKQPLLENEEERASTEPECVAPPPPLPAHKVTRNSALQEASRLYDAPSSICDIDASDSEIL